MCSAGDTLQDPAEQGRIGAAARRPGGGCSSTLGSKWAGCWACSTEPSGAGWPAPAATAAATEAGRGPAAGATAAVAGAGPDFFVDGRKEVEGCGRPGTGIMRGACTAGGAAPDWHEEGAPARDAAPADWLDCGSAGWAAGWAAYEAGTEGGRGCCQASDIGFGGSCGWWLVWAWRRCWWTGGAVPATATVAVAAPARAAAASPPAAAAVAELPAGRCAV